ncbi:hypothetical protein [uncultured Bdellovibrio sp.]|uniref:hypothetical protein n=1 Tax=Bdellovibrio sp. HCB-162 TaxID=3394234 RepID=UPI0025DE783E|nr:hypothetical protein [uncultured Bdellovibrio sp.]
MSSKILSLTLAGVMGLQSVAFAQTDRTAGIGTEQIRTAKENIRSVKAELLALDQALSTAKENIQKRDHSGAQFSSTTIAGAALGLGLSVYAAFSLRSRGGEMSGILGMLAAMTGMVMSGVSAGTSALDQATKQKVDVKDLNDKLTKAESEVQSALASTSDKSSVALLKQLEGNLQGIRATLANYDEKDASISKNKLIAEVTQAAGVAITVYGMARSESRAILIGPLVMSAGNLGQIVGNFSDAEAEQVIKEIESTRRALISAAVTLE